MSIMRVELKLILIYTVEPDLTPTEILSVSLNSLAHQNDSDIKRGKTTPIQGIIGTISNCQSPPKCKNLRGQY